MSVQVERERRTHTCRKMICKNKAGRIDAVTSPASLFSRSWCSNWSVRSGLKTCHPKWMQSGFM